MGFLDKLFGNPASGATIEPITVIESSSPKFPLTALVECDDRVAYFYIFNTKERGSAPKSCWVRNLVSSNTVDNVRGQMKKGLAPVLPSEFVKPGTPVKELDAERLEIVWFEECDAAALMEDGEVLAVIPSWSGKNGFHGYSKDCAIQSPVCWPLTEDNYLVGRTKRAHLFWESIRRDDFWITYQDHYLSSYEKSLGKHDRYFAIDGGMWPPKALVRKTTSNGTVLLSLGVSIIPQPTVELYSEEPEKLRRFELAFYGSGEVTESQLIKMSEYISGQSNLPWTNYTWLGNGHTIGCSVFVDGVSSEFDGVLLTTEFGFESEIELCVFGDKVNILWLVPISKAERKLSTELGSAKLLELLTDGGVGRAYKKRKSIV